MLPWFFPPSLRIVQTQAIFHGEGQRALREGVNDDRLQRDGVSPGYWNVCASFDNSQDRPVSDPFPLTSGERTRLACRLRRLAAILHPRLATRCCWYKCLVRRRGANRKTRGRVCSPTPMKVFRFITVHGRTPSVHLRVGAGGAPVSKPALARRVFLRRSDWRGRKPALRPETDWWMHWHSVDRVSWRERFPDYGVAGVTSR